MKYLIFVFFLFGILNLGLSQNGSTETTLFAQCKLTIKTQDEAEKLNNDLQVNPYVKLVRIDFHSQRAFVLTKNIETLSEDEFRSWFSEYGESIICLQIGIHGLDKINSYPFENCQN